MQWRRWLRAGRDAGGRFWPALLVGLLAIAVVVSAVAYKGKPNADLHLNDDILYVTNQDAERIGQVNGQINDLVASSQVYDRTVQVLQDRDTVVAWNQTANQLLSYDPAAQVMGAPVNLPENAGVTMNGGALAVVNRASGKGWTGPVAKVLGTDMRNSAAQFDLGAPAQIVLATDGKAIALVPSRAEIVHIDANGKKQSVKLPFVLGFDQARVQLSAVGDKAVVLDGNNGQYWVEGDGHASSLPNGNDAVLAQPAEHGIKVQGRDVRAVIETPAGLVGSTREDEFVLLQSGDAGAKVAPLVNGDCAYGAAGASVQIACTGQPARAVAIPKYAASQQLQFRANREVVGLNESATGRVWMVNAGMKLITDWTRVQPPKPKDAGQQESDETQKVNPDRSKPNRPPVAKDDELTVRAGRATMLDVLANDYDPDGDILTVKSFTDPQKGSLALVRGGTQLQFTAPPDAEGQTLSFRYTIDDGRGGTASANVTVHVVSANQKAVNNAPVQFRQGPHVIAQNSQLSVRALLDWKDPEGDDLVVVGAQMVDDADDIVTFTPDGVINYTDVGKKSGQKTIKVTVSDGVATTDGVVALDVRKSGQVPPVANGDYYETEVGQDLLARPLDNDQGSNLLLSFVNRNLPGATVTPDFDTGTFHFTASKPGTYYVDYVVSSGPTAYGLVRIDVKASEAQNRPPIAVRDVALLPLGGSVLVDPLLNDEDPDGDVLVLQSVSSDPHLQIEMSERHLLTIKAITTPQDPIALTYNVSDGLHSVQGTIVVIPAPNGADTKPIAVNDDVTVRAGATATVNVLQNDYSPIGSKLKLDPKLVSAPPGFAWVDGDTLRYTAPSQPGQYQAIYQVTDELGQVGSAVVRYVVVAADAENRAPVAKEVDGRVLAGTKTKIPIPLEGLDPNGDAVRLIGLDSGPLLGRITAVGDHWLEYESYTNSAGTDTFRYAVTDSFGLKGIGEIRVGVAPPTKDNNNPTAIDDRITVRPNKTVRLPVLANDYDQDGDRFGFAKDPLNFQVPARVVSDSEIEVQVGDKSVQGSYAIEDARGGRAAGNVVITVDPNAPALPPIARDDQVSAAQVAGQNVIDVPVLANDVDPDGNLDDATVTVPSYPCQPDECATVPTPQPGSGAKGKVVRVHVGKTMQQIRYEVKDSDGLTASALIIVPGNADATPALKGDTPELEVTAGEPLELDINQYVIGTKSQRVILTGDERVWASSGQGQAVNDHTVRFTSAATYAGPGSIVFEVTDGKNSSDPAGKKAVLSIPIKVKPRPAAARQGANTEKLDNPPVAPTVTLQVGAGEPERSVNLRDSASDPDGDPLSFTQPTGDVPPGLSVKWDAVSKLSASADLTTAPGTRAVLHGQVSDGRGATTPVEINVVVVPTSAPRASVQDDIVANANQGQPVTVSPLQNDTSPWPDKPLSIVSVVTESGSGSTPQLTGTQVTVTPASDFVGTLVVRYTVADATKSPDRYVDGRIRVTVRGRPSTPQTPRVTDTSDINHQVTLTWPASSDNGAPISHYTVTALGANGSHVTQDCPSTTCTITGLTNGVSYTFTVTATNEVGTSLPSERSAPITPDQKPPAPADPTGESGDHQANVTWAAVSYDGTPITSYDVQVQSADVNTVKAGLTGTATTITGLTNGTGYVFRVRATNQSGMTSEWSAPSTSVVPAGLPGKPATVTAIDTPENTGGKVVITWSPADPNGDPPKSYTITGLDPQGNVVMTQTLPSSEWTVVAGSTNLQATLASPNGTLHYTVAATNKVGTGLAATSPEVVIYGAPAVPATPTLSPGNQVLHVHLTAPQTNGQPVTSYILNVTIQSGKTVTVTHAGGATDFDLTDLSGNPVTNGYAYTASVAACAQSSTGGAPKCSAQSAQSGAVVPLGDMGQPHLDYDVHPDTAWQQGYDTNQTGTAYAYYPDGNTNVPSTAPAGSHYSNGNPVEVLLSGTRSDRSPSDFDLGATSSVKAYLRNTATGATGPVATISYRAPLSGSGSGSKITFQVSGVGGQVTSLHCVLAEDRNRRKEVLSTDISIAGDKTGSGSFTASDPSKNPFSGKYLIRCSSAALSGDIYGTVTV